MVLTRRSRKKTPKPRRILVRKSFKDKKDNLIKQTLKKVYTKLINNSDEQLKRQILKNIERVIDGENDESDSESDPRKPKNSKISLKRIRPIISDSSDTENDENSANTCQEVINLRDFQVKVKKLTYQEIAKLSGNDILNSELLERLKNKEETDSGCGIEICSDQPGGEFEIHIEEIPDQIEELPQSDLNIDENSSSDDGLIQSAGYAKEPQTESSEVIELDDDSYLAKINAQVTELIKDLASELPQNPAPIVPHRKSVDSNEVIVIDDEDDIEQKHTEEMDQPVNTSTIQKPSQILVINKQKLKDLLDNGNDVQSIIAKFGINIKPRLGNDKLIQQKPHPDIGNIHENSSTRKESIVPGNTISVTNDKKLKKREIVLKVFQIPSKNFNLQEILKHPVKPIAQNPPEPPVGKNIHVEPVEYVLSNSTFKLSASEPNRRKSVHKPRPESEPEFQESTTTAPSENLIPNKKKIILKIINSGNSSKESTISAANVIKLPESIMKKIMETKTTQEAKIENQRKEPKSIVATSPSPTGSTSTNQGITTQHVTGKTATVTETVGNALNKPTRRESLLRVKSFANESLIPNSKSNVSSLIVTANERKSVHEPCPEPTFQESTTAASTKDLSSSSEDLTVAMQSRSKLRPWIKDSKPEPYYKIKLELLSCPSLHADYKCMNLKCAFFTSSAELFSKHLQQHLLSDPANTILACPYCTFQSSNVDGLIQHISVYHEYDRYMCSCCFYRALDSSNVMWHMKQYHPNSPKVIFELDTKKLFSKLYRDLTYEAMRRNVPPLICLFCKEKFMTFEMYTNHIEAHTGTFEFTMTCSICDDQISKQSLVEHFKICNGFGIYQCINCKFGTDNINSIRSHLANEHPSKPVCVVSRKYKNYEVLYQHDPTLLTLVKASTKIDGVNIRKYKYPYDSLLNRERVLKIDYTDFVQGRRITTNFDQTIPCSIIEKQCANSTVTSNIATPAITSAEAIKSPFRNYVSLSGNFVNSINIENPNVKNSSPVVCETIVPEQIVVPKICNVFSFQNISWPY